MPKIIYTDSYNKKAGKFIKKHPELKNQYKKALEILEVNPYHASLRLHKLEGKLKDLYSISINMRYRISLEFIIEDEKIIPINVGSHDEIY
ncbi:MAG: type II toxin-antitoxin system RelE/ParE family toxin [Spirochaetes bacterium]|nr:type II toxin-antitoxin system RelE/ParE family toxin [Spirochaetota bacterium]